MNAASLTQIGLSTALVGVTVWYAVSTARLVRQSRDATEHARDAAIAAAESARHGRDTAETARLSLKTARSSLAAQTVPVVTLATCELLLPIGRERRLAFRLWNIGRGPGLALTAELLVPEDARRVLLTNAPISVGAQETRPRPEEDALIQILPEWFDARRRDLTVVVEASDVLGNRWRTETDLATSTVSVRQLDGPSEPEG
jgi:hypothetical protein